MRYIFTDDYVEHSDKGNVIKYQIGTYVISNMNRFGDEDGIFEDTIETDLVIFNPETLNEAHVTKILVRHSCVNQEFVPRKIRLVGECKLNEGLLDEESIYNSKNDYFWFIYDLDKDKNGNFCFERGVNFWVTFEKVDEGRYFVFLNTEKVNDICISAESFGL